VGSSIPTNAAAAAAADASSASRQCSACCQGGFVVLRNLTTLVLSDTTRSLAVDKSITKGAQQHAAQLARCFASHRAQQRCRLCWPTWQRQLTDNSCSYLKTCQMH
jgi:hypothetical protein